MIKFTIAQRALWLSTAAGLAVLSSLFTFFTLYLAALRGGSLDDAFGSAWWLLGNISSMGKVWSGWLLIIGIFSMLSSLDGVPAIFRSTLPTQLKASLLALHLGGALTFLVPLGLFVHSILYFDWGRF